MKYIDAEKLIAEIEKRAKFHDDAMKACIGLNNIAITHSAGWKEDTELLAIITSLQQEQQPKDFEEAAEKYADSMGLKGFDRVRTISDFKAGAEWKEQPEVDLEKEIKNYCRDYYNCNYPDQIQNGRCSPVMPHIVEAARHFYELGLNARKP